MRSWSCQKVKNIFFLLMLLRVDCEIRINHSYSIKIQLRFPFWEFQQITIPKHTFCPASALQLSIFFISSSSIQALHHFWKLSTLHLSFSSTIISFFFSNNCQNILLHFWEPFFFCHKNSTQTVLGKKSAKVLHKSDSFNNWKNFKYFRQTCLIFWIIATMKL